MMDQLIGLIIGFLTFFLFPISEYLIKVRFSRNSGNPELWYLPDYGFRLVIRNIPKKSKLYDLKYRSRIRKIIPATLGSSVATITEIVLIDSEDFFLLPGYDQIILSFQLRKEGQDAFFIHTNNLGKQLSKFPLDEISELTCDYTAHLDNRYHFDLFVGRRVVIKRTELKAILDQLELNSFEQRFALNTIIKIG